MVSMESMSFEIDDAIIINENPDNDEWKDCCKACGSLGIIHFEDSDNSPDIFHRCMRCDHTWYECAMSKGTTLQERLNSSTTKDNT